MFHNVRIYSFNVQERQCLLKMSKSRWTSRINSLYLPIKPSGSDIDIIDDVQTFYQYNVLRIDITQF